MATQGIVVSIKAKIEGWEEQIKNIQNAMKNIKPGTEFSKGLAKDLQQVNTMVNNLGKNMTQRLTSDSQVNSFVDKVRDIESVFNRIGQSMQSISFADMSPEYITSNFEELLSVVQKTNDALSAGMQSSFEGAISGSKILQKEFSRMGLDAKNMNIDSLKDALSNRGQGLTKELELAQKETDRLAQKMQEAGRAKEQLQQRKDYIGNDPQAKVLEILGGKIPVNGTILDTTELKNKRDEIRAAFVNMGFTEGDLNRILPSVDKIMQAAQWDQLPTKLANYIQNASVKTETSLAFATERHNQAKTDYYTSLGKQNHLSALKYGNTQAQQELSTKIVPGMEQATQKLREEVNNVTNELQSKVTSGIVGLGGQIASESAQGYNEAAEAMQNYKNQLAQITSKEQMMGKVQGVVQRYFSIYAAVRMATKGIRSMMDNIKNLDKTITGIAIVTKMNQDDLWGQMPQYTKMARDYAASISGVYEVSQLYYQQGLGQADVMALTEQTLKMARISGLDYADATDYMTNAIRSFKMEMTDAGTVVDVYSAVAASSASSVTELATAMSKTASSAAAVGSSFENTTAMLAVMIEATRESPENIGSAMKSIISRYGELKENKTGIDAEGEEYSLNKVDKALQTVGISIHDANGEFRDFDDVIMELAEKWNTIDKNTQRYIATIMAGNRQQSRFLALVSSYDRLREESEKAANSEDASQLQFLKTLDSVEAKTQQLQTSLQSLYTSSGMEKLYKGALDFGNAIAESLSNLSQKQGLGAAVGKIAADFTNMATLATTAFSFTKTRLSGQKGALEYGSKIDQARADSIAAQAKLSYLQENPVKEKVKGHGNKAKIINQAEVDQYKTDIENAGSEKAAADARVDSLQASYLTYQKQQSKMAKLQGWGMAASAAGMALGAWANQVDINKQRGLKAGLTVGSSALSGLGTGLMVGATAGGPIGALVGVLSALPGVIQGIGMFTETTAERLSKIQTNIDNAKNEKIKSKDELKTLEDYKKKYDELSKSQYESTEKKKEFIELSNSIAASYPELIKSMDAEGNYLISMTNGYQRLAEAKRNAYKNDIVDLMASETAGLKDADYVISNIYGQKLIENQKNITGWWDVSSESQLMNMDYSNIQQDKISSLFRGGKGALTANTIFKEISGLGYDNEIIASDWLDKTQYDTGKNPSGKGDHQIFYYLNEAGTDALTQLYSDFIGKIKDKKGYSEAIDELLEQYAGQANYEDAIKRFNPEVYKELSIRQNLPEYQQELLDNRVNSYNNELIDLFADTTNETFNMASSDIQKRFAQAELNNQFKDWDKKLDKDTKTDPEKWKTAVQNFYAGYDATWYHAEQQAEYINSLTDKENEVYQNLGKYTQEDIEKMFSEQSTEGLEGARLAQAEIANKRAQLMKQIFEEDYQDIIDTYNGWIEQNESLGINDYSKNVGAEYLPQLQSQYNNILKNTSLSETQMSDQIRALNGITDFITSDTLTFDQKSALLSKYSTADFTSLIGIYDFVDELSGMDIDLDLSGLIGKVKSFGNLLSINFESEIDSYYDNIESSVDDFNKAMSAAISGTDLKTAREMADKMGKSLSDFDVRGGKFYFDDIEALRDAYIKENDEYIADVKQNVSDRYSTLEKLSEIQVTSEEGTVENTIDISGSDIIKGNYDIKTLNDMFTSERSQVAFRSATGVDYTEFINYYEKFQDQLDGGTTDFIEFMLQQVDENLSESGTAILNYLQQNQAISQIKSGDVEGFMKTTGLWQEEDSSVIVDKYNEIMQKDAENKQNLATIFEQSWNESNQEYLETFEQSKQEQINQNKKDQDTLNNAYKDALEQASLAQDRIESVNEYAKSDEIIKKAAQTLGGGIHPDTIIEAAKKLNEEFDNGLLEQIEYNNTWASQGQIERELIEAGGVSITKVNKLAEELKQQDLEKAGYDSTLAEKSLYSKEFWEAGQERYNKEFLRQQESWNKAGLSAAEQEQKAYEYRSKEMGLITKYASEEYNRAVQENKEIASITTQGKDYFSEAWLQFQSQGYTSYYTADEIAALSAEREKYATAFNSVLSATIEKSTWESFIPKAKEQLGVKEYTQEQLEAKAQALAMQELGIAQFESTDWQDYMPEEFKGLTAQDIAQYNRQMAKENNEILQKQANVTWDSLLEQASQELGIDDKTSKEVIDQAKKIAEETYNIPLSEYSESDLLPEGWENWSEEKKKAYTDAETIAKRQANKAAAMRIARGDTSVLIGTEGEQYSKEIYEMFNGITRTISSDMIKAVGKEGADHTWVTQENQATIEALQDLGWIKKNYDAQENEIALKVGDKVEYDLARISQNTTGFLLNTMSLYDTTADKVKVLTDYYDAAYTDQTTAFNKMLSEDTVSLSDFATYLTENKGHTAEELADSDTLSKLASDYGLKLTKAGKYIIEDYNQYVSALTDDLDDLIANEATDKEINEVKAKISDAKNYVEQSRSEAAKKLIDSYDNLSTDDIAQIATAFGQNYEYIESLLSYQGNGRYKMDFSTMQQLLKDQNLPEIIQDSLNTQMAETADDYMKNINEAVSLVSEGTKNKADIQKFIDSAKQLGIDAQDAFSYDSLLNAWTLDPQVMKNYIQAQGQKLVDDGLLSVKEANDYIDKNVREALVSQVDIKSFLDAENRGTEEGSQARDKLKTALKNAGIWQKDVILQSENWIDYYNDLTGTSEIQAKDAARRAKKANDLVREEAAERFIEDIEYGGIDAVNAMQTIATLQGKELTSADIESAYRAQVSQIEAASEALTYGVGSLVSGEAIQMLEDAGYKLQMMGDGNTAVIEQIGDISTAYENYYLALYNTGEATLGALNEAYAKVLETKDGRDKEQKAIDALGEASGMTYTTFSELLTDMGIELTDDLIDELEFSGITEAMGGNKMRIKNFAAFARRMNWDYNSEEYLSAFSSFNDGLVEQKNKNQNQAKQELDKLKDAKPGDLLNLTYTMSEMEKWAEANGKSNQKEIKQAKKRLSKLNDSTAIYWKTADEIYNLEQNDYVTQFANALAATGAILKDSTLDLRNANKLDVANVIQEYASMLGPEITDLAQSILTSYTDAITKGIEGGMTNVEKADLTKIAQDMGINLPDNAFQQTAEGLQLSSDYAIQMYEAISNVDALQGNLVFKSLSESLKKNNRNYKTANKLLTYANKLQRQLTDETEKTGKKQDDLNDKLEAERKLAKKSAMDAYGNAEEDWDFRNDFTLPDDVSNMIEYYTAWGSIYGELEAAVTSKKMGTETITDAVYGAEQIANATGQAVEVMGKLIGGETGISARQALSDINKALRYDNKNGAYYDVKTLQALGWDISKGGYNRTKTSVNTGMDTYFKGVQADAQKWNDFALGGVALQEYMDQHNMSIDSLFDENGIIKYKQFQDIIENGGFSEAWNKFADSIKVGDQTLREAFSNPQTFKNDMEGYSNAIRSFLNMMNDAEGWDNADRFGSLASMMAKYNFNGDITVDGTTIIGKNGKVVIQGKDKKGNEVITDDTGATYENINEALTAMSQRELDDYAKQFDNYQDNGTGKTNEISYEINGQTYTIEVDGDHYIVKKGNTEITGPNGEPYTDVSKAIEATQEDAGLKDKMSQAGFQEFITHGGSASYGKNAQNGQNSFGVVSETARETIRANNYNAQQLANIANDIFGTRGLTGQAASAEFKAVTGIDWDPADGERKGKNYAEAAAHGYKSGFKSADFQNIVDQSLDLTQTAADVMSGMAAAFSNEQVQQNLSNSISQGMQGAFEAVTTDGVPTGEITINPTSITVNTEGVQPEAVQDMTIPGGTITIIPTNTVVDAAAGAEAAEGGNQITITGTVNYDNQFTTETPPDQVGGTAKYDKNLFKTQTPPTLYGGTAVYIPTVKGSLPTLSGGIARYVAVVQGTKATGNVGLATGNAHAKSTLMGELGPEMVVSNGRYFVVGQSGPEFVDLSDDAIVFNHLQTQSLLEKGTSPTRGKAIMNERRAVSYAKGNINGGPARGGGGFADTVYSITSNNATNASTVFGGSSGNGAPEAPDLGAFIKDLERWYNWLQRIAKLETEISYQEALRSKYESSFSRTGADYYNSQIKSLEKYNSLIKENQSLVQEQQAFLEKRLAELQNGAFGKLYDVKDGQLVYKSNDIRDRFMEEFGASDSGAPNHNAQEQYEWLQRQGLGEYLKYDSSGKEIKFENEGKPNPDAWRTGVESALSRLDKERDEIQGLIDSIDEHTEAIESAEAEQNAKYKEMEDNQISVENKVMDAVIEKHEREIELLEDQRDALEKNNQALLDGLNRQLDNERNLYQNQQDKDELSTLQRQLSILERSGGSASEIASLKEQIEGKQYDVYFDTQEDMINNLQEAMDTQIEKLDTQIDLMTETLDYQKEYGLLWNEVNQILEGNPESIANYIQTNTEAYWGKSTTDLAQTIRQDLFEIDQFKQLQKDGGLYGLIQRIADKVAPQAAPVQSTSSEPSSGGGSGGSSGGGSPRKKNPSNPYKVTSESNNLINSRDQMLATLNTNTGQSTNTAIQKNYTQAVEKEKKRIQNKVNKIYIQGNAFAKGTLLGELGPEAYVQNGQFKVAGLNGAEMIKLKKDAVVFNHQQTAQLISSGHTNGRATPVTSVNAAVENNAQEKYRKAIEEQMRKQQEMIKKQQEQKLAMLKQRQEQLQKQREEMIKQQQARAKAAAIQHTSQFTQTVSQPVSNNNHSQDYRQTIQRFWETVERNKHYVNSINNLNYPNTSALSSIMNNNDAVIIENASVNMNIEKLADDYGAQRAGEQALARMLEIARKSSSQNRIGR